MLQISMENSDFLDLDMLVSMLFLANSLQHPLAQLELVYTDHMGGGGGINTS